MSNEANNFYIANNEPFEIFSASAKDPNLIGNITTQVYYDYGKDSNGKYLRYTSPTDYELSRGNISTDLVYDMNVGLQDNSLSCVFDLLNKGASYAMRTI